MPRLSSEPLESYCDTVLLWLFNTVPNILSLAQSRVLPVSSCFFLNPDLRNGNPEQRLLEPHAVAAANRRWWWWWAAVVARRAVAAVAAVVAAASRDPETSAALDTHACTRIQLASLSPRSTQ